MGKPHVHAEFIKAKADGREIEERGLGIHGIWIQMPAHDWKFSEQCQYRVKPEPPAKVYPVTGMRDCDLCSAYFNGGNVSHKEEVLAFKRIANAALRHAIDNNQLVQPHESYEVAPAGHRDARDMAIAEACRSVFELEWKMGMDRAGYSVHIVSTADLPAIIATVKE